jgi:glycosyltransferase involved in cell wall biosynthesis
MRIANACQRAQIPYVACPHDPYSPELFGTRQRVKKLYWHLLERPFLRRAVAIHVLAPSHERFLRNGGIDVPILVVPNGLESEFLEKARGSGPKPRTSPRNEVSLLYFGRWDVYNKGLDLLLLGLAQGRDAGLCATLRIVGKSSPRERSLLRQSIDELVLDKIVSLEGFLPEVWEAVREADFVVLPSRFDGFGQVVLEALALGTPVIVSSRAGAAEYFDSDQGVLVFEPNPATIAELLKVVQPVRDEMTKAATSARPVIAREYIWPTLAKRWIREVDSIIASKAR